MIKQFQRDEIDVQKWDKCIRNSPNGRLYAMSYYLDLVCGAGRWIGLVQGDYEAVCPLPVSRKVPLMPRIVLPLYAQQLGIFSPNKSDETTVSEFIKTIPNKYRSIYLQLNDANKLNSISNGELKNRDNFVLDLSKNYEEMSTEYSKNLKRNIKKAQKNELTPEEIDIKRFTHFYIAQTSKETNKKFKLHTFLPALISAVIKKGDGKIWGIQNEDQKILAACLITKFNQRLTYLLARSSQEGKDKGAMHSVIDAVIKENANTPAVLDFEGSEIKSIAGFFQSFGAKNIPYTSWTYKRFPF